MSEYEEGSENFEYTARRFQEVRRQVLTVLSYASLHSTRIPSDLELADGAIENCRRSASCNPPRFECDGAFASWLVRVLIDEALAVRVLRLSRLVQANRHGPAGR
jgi:hypothetical protein